MILGVNLGIAVSMSGLEQKILKLLPLFVPN